MNNYQKYLRLFLVFFSLTIFFFHSNNAFAQESAIRLLPSLSRPSVKNGDTLKINVIATSVTPITSATATIADVDETVTLKLTSGTDKLGNWSYIWLAHNLQEKEYIITLHFTDSQGFSKTDSSLHFTDPTVGTTSIGSSVYNPTDSFSRVSSLTLLPGANKPQAGVIDTANGFAYFSTVDNPVEVIKIRLSDFTIVNELTLSSGNQSNALTIDTTNGFLYVGTRGAPGEIHKIRLSDFTEVAKLLLAAGENNVSSAIIDIPNGYAYFGLNVSPGKIVKVRLSDFTEVGTTITLASGKNSVYSAVIDQPGGFAYFGTLTVPGYVIKVDLSTFTVSNTLTLGAGENDLEAAAIDTSGGYVYFGLDVNPGGIVKIRLSDFTKIGTLTLAAGHGSVFSAAPDISNGYIYWGLDIASGPNGGGTIIKMKLSDFSENASLVLGNYAGQDFLESATIDPTNGYAYFGGADLPGSITRVHLSDFTTYEAITPQAENNIGVSIVDSVNGYAYLGEDTNPAQIIKIRLSDFTRVAAITTYAAEVNLDSAVIDTTNGFVYFGAFGIVVKVRLSDFTRVGAITLTNATSNLYAAVIDTTNGLAYFTSGNFPGVVAKIDLSTFTQTGSLIMQSGENSLRSAVIDVTGGYLYVGTSTSPGQIIRVKLSDLSEVDKITLSSGDNALTSAVIDPVNGYAYFVTDTSPSRIKKIRLSDFTLNNSLTLSSNENLILDNGVVDLNKGLAFFVTGDSPSRLVSLRLSDFSDLGTTVLNSPSEDYPQVLSIDPVNQNLYTATYAFPSVAVKLHYAVQNNIEASKVTLSETAAVVNSLNVYSDTAFGTMRLALYDSSKNLLWQSGDTTNTTVGGWMSINIADGTPTSLRNLAAGTYYLALQSSSGAGVTKYTTGSSGDGFQLTQTFGSFPSTIAGESNTANNFSLYASYSTSAIITDTFNRADSATTLGTADSGQVWQALQGTFGISSNQAYVLTCSAPSYAVLNTGLTNIDEVITLTTNHQDARIPFRVVDLNNLYYLENDVTQYSLVKKVSGSATSLGQTIVGPANGDVIKISANGTHIKVYINNVLEISVVDSSVSGTSFGIGTWCDTSMRFDNLSLTYNGPDPTPEPTQANLPADHVVGQKNLQSGDANQGGAVDSHGFSYVSGVETDGTHLFVSDCDNNRVLIYDHIPTADNTPADHVIGQADMSGSDVNQGGIVAANTLSCPWGVFYDGSKLYVADSGNNRVLIYNHIPTVDNASADHVIGQPNLQSGNANQGGTADANTLSLPDNAFVDPTSKKLIIDDYTNSRVLIYNAVPSADNASADHVIGQPNLQGSSANQGASTDANTLKHPYFARIYNGKVFVADSGNHRVLIYNTIPTADNVFADVVIGQINMQTNTSAVSSTELNLPTDMLYDGTNLIVQDDNNNRLLYFTGIPTTNTPEATKVVGHTTFEDSSYNNCNCATVVGNAFNDPEGGLAFSSPYLFVGDSGNNRVLIFGAVQPTPTSTPGTATSGGTNASSCTTAPPQSAPNLYQINTTDGNATLYFSPAADPVTSYAISYGTTTDANQYAVSLKQGHTNGAIMYTISSLLQNVTYYFKVQPRNDCQAGQWSNTMAAITDGTVSTLSSALLESLIGGIQTNTNEQSEVVSPTPSISVVTPTEAIPQITGSTEPLQTQKTPSFFQGTIVMGIASIRKSPEGPLLAGMSLSVATIIAAVFGLPQIAELFSLEYSSLSDLPLLVRRFFLLFDPIIKRKKYRPWGLVYDAATKQPVDPAIVTLKGLDGKEIDMQISDFEGRFGFLVEKGIYTLFVKKSNFIFPSKIMRGKKEDYDRKHLYFGENLTVDNPDLVDVSIPIDPVGYNWNQANKPILYHKPLFAFSDRMPNVLVTIGIVLNILGYILSPNWLSGILTILYLLLAVRFFLFTPKKWGTIYNEFTRRVIPNVTIKAIAKATGLVIAVRVTDKRGRYHMLLPQGTYTLSIEKVTDDVSRVINARHTLVISKQHQVVGIDIGVKGE